ncbi:MAG TPA: sigma-54 dependent transcriptional regulator, partial [Bacteroidales bacterium]|nr:sigma-54 dependent transcriptional regulator [Bacteroidales bacterium]
MTRVLIVDDDPTFCMMLKSFLTSKGFEVGEAFNATNGMKSLREASWDILLTDYRLPDKDGIELLKEAKAVFPHLPVILMTRYTDIRIAVNAIKLGAFEYVAKPVNPDEILHLIGSALQKQATGSNNQPAHGILSEFNYIEGVSRASQQITRYIQLVAPTDMSVIIHGESGTGKEYVARLIHLKSARSRKPFVAVDCGALSKELAGSELFGHVKGSFTDAHSDKIGQFQLANGGTLFLDEIGNLSYGVQLKMLRATQERKIKRLGGIKDIDVDVRIIVASNEDLDKIVKKGAFREDLYHRLNEFKIDVPPLRERPGDIDLFSQYFLNLANRELNKAVASIGSEAMEIFRSYPWPGNIRELKNVIKRATLLCQDSVITPFNLPAEMLALNQPTQSQTVAAGTTDLKLINEINE